MLTSLAHRLVAIPQVYEIVQAWARLDYCNNYCREQLGPLPPGLKILDAAGGTGLARPIFPDRCDYVCLDNDPDKLALFKDKGVPGEALLGDVMAMPIPDKSIDLIYCRSLGHHLGAAQTVLMLAEASRVLKEDGRLMYVDAYLNRQNLLSRLLWHFDPGTHPPTLAEIIDQLSGRFEIEFQESIRTRHDVLVAIARPRKGS